MRLVGVASPDFQCFFFKVVKVNDFRNTGFSWPGGVGCKARGSLSDFLLSQR